jgi:hypothetical protein
MEYGARKKLHAHLTPPVVLVALWRMKNFILKCSVLTVIVATLCAAGYGIQELRSGDGSIYRTGSVLTMDSGSTLTIAPTVAPSLVRRVVLGTPAAAAANGLVTSTNMTNAAYTLAAPVTNAVARNITATTSTVNGADVVGSLVITGTDITGATLTETVALATNGIAYGTKAFKVVSALTSTGHTATGTNDTVVIGTGVKLGLPVPLPTGTVSVLTTVAGVPATTTATAGAIPVSTVDASAGTYNGSNEVVAYPAY